MANSFVESMKHLVKSKMEDLVKSKMEEKERTERRISKMFFIVLGVEHGLFLLSLKIMADEKNKAGSLAEEQIIFLPSGEKIKKAMKILTGKDEFKDNILPVNEIVQLIYNYIDDIRIRWGGRFNLSSFIKDKDIIFRKQENENVQVLIKELLFLSFRSVQGDFEKFQRFLRIQRRLIFDK